MQMLRETIQDTITIIPILFVAYLLIEYYERKSVKNNSLFLSLQRYGPIVGALVGIFPQCGFSVLAATLFIENKISMGTLLSVFIATSDEMVPILLAHPNEYTYMGLIIVIKIGVAIIVGYLVDKVIFNKMKVKSVNTYKFLDENESHPFYVSALIRTVKIYAFIFITTMLLNALLSLLGSDVLSRVLLEGNLFQPVLSALFGFIPNCVASVVLTQLYISGNVSFASLTAGLITNAGLGILVLIRYRLDKKILFRIIMLLFLSAISTGLILTFIAF